MVLHLVYVYAAIGLLAFMLFIAYMFQEQLVIEFEKTMCYGTCPVYKAKIYDSGRLEYEGLHFVKIVGHHNYTIPFDVVRSMLQKAKDIGFFEMKDKYDSIITDIPATIITIHHKGEKKRIYARHKVPDKLWKFLNEIHAEIMTSVGN